MSLKDTARHQAAREIGSRHPYLVLLVGPLLPAIVAVLVIGLVIWGLVELVDRVAENVSVPGLPSFSVPDVSMGSGLLILVTVVVGLLVVRKAWRWSNGY